MRFYRGLRRAGLSVDIGPPTPETVADRKFILAPGLFTASGELVEALSKSPATLLLGPRTGSKTADFQIPPNLPPGPLRALIDLRVRRAESLRPTARIAMARETGHFEGWREFLILSDEVETVLASQDGACALARRDNRYYLAGWPDETLLDAVLARLLAEAGVAALTLPRDIRVRDNGALRFVFNYGPEPADISSLLGDAALLLGEKILPPCGVAAFALTPPS
jgi:beta-galactosidase